MRTTSHSQSYSYQLQHFPLEEVTIKGGLLKGRGHASVRGPLNISEGNVACRYVIASTTAQSRLIKETSSTGVMWKINDDSRKDVPYYEGRAASTMSSALPHVTFKAYHMYIGDKG